MDILYGDKRLQRNTKALHAEMVRQQSVCLRKLGGDRAGEMRFGRCLQNKKVSVVKLIEEVCAGIGQRSQGRHVLLIQDTSEINYQAHARRVQGLGSVGNGTDIGFFIHPVLAVDAQDGACLGLAHLHLWQRRSGKATHKATNYRQLAIEDKESYRWIDAPTQARQRLGQGSQATIVADRESDIYEMWARLPDARTELLVRAHHDRELHTPDAGSLNAWLGQLPEQGCYRLGLNATKKRSAHTACMHVRYGCTRIMRPQRSTDKGAPASVQLWAIEVLEDAASVPAGQAPVHWRLLTTHALHSLQDALQCVDWYRQRWHIEQTFRTLKSQGLDIESSLLEEATRLEKLATLALSAAVHTMQLTLAREGHSQRPATDCFEERDQAVLHQVGASLQGKTVKQKNPHMVHSLAWAAWIVARLGGWKGYASERPPGPITMLRGLQALANIRQGWELAHAKG
jgi:hypothetical protein